MYIERVSERERKRKRFLNKWKNTDKKEIIEELKWIKRLCEGNMPHIELLPKF